MGLLLPARPVLAAIADNWRADGEFDPGMAMRELTPREMGNPVSLEPDLAISLYNRHTGESLDRVFWAKGEFVPETMAEINRLCRDLRSGKVANMDPGLIMSLARLRDGLETRAPIQVVNGYRAPETNAVLRKKGQVKARNSFHVRGMALDIRIDGLDSSRVHKAALAMKSGGVGYYPRRGFIHIDTGPVRNW